MFIDNVHIDMFKSALTFKIALNDACNGNVNPCQVNQDQFNSDPSNSTELNLESKIHSLLNCFH